MSKYTNANWDHFKLAGREPPGDAVPHEEARRRLSDPATCHRHRCRVPE